MVLAGGASRRFGGLPKGLQRVGERLRMLDFVFAALSEVTDRVVIASNDPQAPDWIPGAAVLPDRHAGAGGLAGIEAALLWDGGRRDVVAVAWDMPFVNGSLLQSLIDVADASDADAVVPESDSPHGIEPFCAFYSRRLGAPLSAFLDGGGGAAHRFLKALPRLELLRTRQIAAAGDPTRLLFSVNTPAELDRARAMLANAN